MVVVLQLLIKEFDSSHMLSVKNIHSHAVIGSVV